MEGLMPTKAWKADGVLMELPVSVPSEMSPKLAAVPAAEPPLEPPVVALRPYGFLTAPVTAQDPGFRV